jgi:hypothetical protein
MIHIDRRTTIKWVLAVAATASVPVSAAARGYGTDPDLQRIYSPGELWPLTLTAQLRATAAALCDVIIPADAHSPSASTVGVVDFIDEWISAPYPRQQQDRKLVLSGLVWIEGEARRRYSKPFAMLSGAEQATMCEQIGYVPEAPASLREAAAFFARYRDLTAAGFYTTPVGHKDLQYVGNVALASFEGPPREALAAVGLAEISSR